MKRRYAVLFLPLFAVANGTADAQQAPGDGEFRAGERLEHPANVRTFGSFRHAESVYYDDTRDVYVAANQGVRNDVIENDGFISLVNPDGTVHTLKWIGVTRDGLTLNDPRGSYIVNGRLYIADNQHIRWFDMSSGEPLGSVFVDGSTLLNDLEVASDGTIYVTDTGSTEENTWRVYRISPDGEATILVQGAPLSRPNGIHFDPDGNLIVLNMGHTTVHTFSPAGDLIDSTETTHTLNDGIVVLEDGTIYISSLTGNVTRIRPGQQAEVIASGIPTAASMGYDPVRNRLVIPQNQQNAITIVELND